MGWQSRRKKQAQKIAKAEKLLLIGYVPLLYGHAGGLIDHKNKKILRAIDRCTLAGHADACLWRMAWNNTPSAVLVIRQAEKIAEHFKLWCEGDLTWFSAYIHQDGERYGVALMQDPARSINRWKTTHLIIHEAFPPKDMKFEVLSSPLRFGASEGKAFAGVVDRLSGHRRISIGLLDKKDLPQDMADIDHDKVHELGEFDLVMGDCGSYLGTYLRQMED
jgi:hypothetical protein